MTGVRHTRINGCILVTASAPPLTAAQPCNFPTAVSSESGRNTLLEIQPATRPARHRFGLKHGALFFFDREQPADVEFETPLATGAIRGTEFFLAAADDDSTTQLAMLDGAVELKTETNN